MILFALNVAIAATLAALAGLAVERTCPKRAIAVRHAVLFVCMIVVGAAPLLAGFARVRGIGALTAWPTPAAIVTAHELAPVDAKIPAIGSSSLAASPNRDATNSRYLASAARRATLLLPAAIDFLLAAWLFGTFRELSRLVRSWLLLRRLSCSAEQVTADMRRLSSHAARRLGLSRTPEVSWCAAPSPLVMGLFEPRILLPRSAAMLPVDELEAALLHEMAHVARHDQWAGLMASAVRACFWWCPAVAILHRRLGDVREELCDAHVVGQQGHGLNLAAALLTVCEGSIRGRLAYAPIAALAAGSSGTALRNRIQTLIEKEDHPMIRTTLHQRLAVGALGFLVAGGATIINVRPAHATDVITLAALSPTLRMVSAADFWSTTGATTKHEFDADTVAELEKLAKDADHPNLALRATKLLCDHAGHSRANDKFGEPDGAHAVTVAFEHLEAHLADPEIAKYAPARGFTHMTISSMGNDGEGIAWVLIETASSPPTFNGGLNIRVDLKASKVTSVKQWGQVRPAPAK